MLNRKLLQKYCGIYLPIILITILAFSSCVKEKMDPKVQTTKLVSLPASTFYASAKVPVRGDYKITDYGFEYLYESTIYKGPFYWEKVSLNNYPLKDTFSTTFQIPDLNYYSSKLFCYTKAYITNEKGTVYGNILESEIIRLVASSIVPKSAKVGDTVAINGSNFDAEIAKNRVTFNNINATIISATIAKLIIKVPKGIPIISDQNIIVKITTERESYELKDTFLLVPTLYGFSPKTGTWKETNITINGSDLDGSSLYIDDNLVNIAYRTSSYFSFTIPTNIQKKRFKFFVFKAGVKMEVPGGYFTMSNLSINSLSQTSYLLGSTISITGRNFNPSISNNFLMLGSTKLTPNNGNSALQFTIPLSLTPGEYITMVSNTVDTVKLPQNTTILPLK